MEILLEQLESLRITKGDTSKKTTKYTNNISTVLVLTAYNKIAYSIMLKSIVPNLE